MAKAGVTTVVAGKVLPVLPNVARAVIGTAGAISGAVKTVKDSQKASDTFKEPNSTTLDKVGVAADVVIDVVGTIGSAAYAYSGINGVLSDIKATNATKLTAIDNPSVNLQSGNRTVSCNGDSSTSLSGEWQQVNETMSDYSREYQTQITGHVDEAWIQNGVKFDGVKNGVLVDAKGHYSQFIDSNGQFISWFSGQDSIIDQATHQIAASEGAPIEWYFSEESTMNAFQSLFDRYGIHGISLIFEPKA